MKELAIQKELCDAAEALDPRNFAYKQNNRFMVGVADLFVKLHQYPVAIIEVKLVSPLDGRGPVAVDITQHQLRYLKWQQEAGVIAGWVAISKCKINRMKRWVYVSTDLNSNPIVTASSDFVAPRFYAKLHGEPWPVEWMVKQMIKELNG